jgi:hypothetical protein
VRSQVPSESIVPHYLRADMKDALAAANAIKRPQDFPALQPVRATGKAQFFKPSDTPLFVPEPVPQPKRRLHTISDEALLQLHRPDKRREELATSMQQDKDSSPMRELWRGDAHGINATHGRRKLPEYSEQGLQQEAVRVTGRAHNYERARSNIVLSQEIVPVEFQKRKRPGEPTPTKGSVY